MKRYFLFLLLSVVLFSYSGCRENIADENTDIGNTYLMDFNYLGANILIAGMERVEDSIYLVYGTNDEEKTSYYRLILNLNDKSTSTVPLETVIRLQQNSEPENTLFDSLTVAINPDGSIDAYQFNQILNDKLESVSEESYYLHYDSDANLICSFPFKEKFNISTDSYISFFKKDCNGYYYIGLFGEPIKLYSPSFQELGAITNSNYSTSLCKTKNGTMIASWNDGSSFQVASLDFTQKKLGKAIVLDKSYGSNTIWGGLENLIYYEDGTDFYSCDVITGEQKKLFSCSTNNLVKDYIMDIYPFENEKLLVLYNDYTLRETSLIIMTPVDPATLNSRTELTLASINPQQDLIAAITAFNRSNSDYRITLVDYGRDTSDYTQALESLQKDMIRGNSPDLIDIRNDNFPLQNWVSQNLLTDLYPLMSDDSGMRKEDLLDNVRCALEINESLYVLPSSFTIHCMMAKSENVNDLSSLTPEVMYSLEQQIPQESRLFYFQTGEYLMSNMVYQNINTFVDYEKGACYFDTPMFRDILEYAKSQPTDTDEDATNIADSLRSGEVIFHDLQMMSCTDYQYYKELFGGDVSCLGFGNNTTGGIRLSFFGSALAITEKCPYKEAAWQFVESYQRISGSLSFGFPCTKDSLTAYLTQAGSHSDTTIYTVGNITLEIGVASEEDINEIKSLIARADTLYCTDPFLLAMMEEELAPYFAGQKTAADVTKILQNRFSVYLKEG